MVFPSALAGIIAGGVGLTLAAVNGDIGAGLIAAGVVALSGVAGMFGVGARNKDFKIGAQIAEQDAATLHRALDEEKGKLEEGKGK